MTLLKMNKFPVFAIAAAALFIMAACTGVQGATGPLGPAGELGAQGPPGLQGPPGESVVVQEVEFAPGLPAGGPVLVSATGSTSDVRWILPGVRRLDPKVFGTPDKPLGFEKGVGVPLEARLTTEDGKAYTTTASPGPFSNSFAKIEGTFSLKAVDATLIDGPTTKDKADFTANFKGPNGKQYTVRVLKVISKGPVHPFFGGVATNFAMHGGTGIGTKLFPEVFAYVSLWGVAELAIDGEVVASNRLVHAMITNRARDEEYKITFDEGVDNSRVQFHLILAPIEITPDGPKPSPVPTGFTLPNGKEQPFLHIVYEDVSVSPGRVLLQN